MPDAKKARISLPADFEDTQSGWGPQTLTSFSLIGGCWKPPESETFSFRSGSNFKSPDHLPQSQPLGWFFNA